MKSTKAIEGVYAQTDSLNNKKEININKEDRNIMRVSKIDTC